MQIDDYEAKEKGEFLQWVRQRVTVRAFGKIFRSVSGL